MSKNNLTALEQKGFAHLILIMIVLTVLLILGGVVVSLGLFKLPSTQNTSTQIEKSQQPTVNLREAYQNPFDRSSEYQNPFDNLK